MNFQNSARNWPAFRVAHREWQWIFSHKATLRLVVLLPLIMFVLFAGIYFQGVVKQLPVAVVDADDSGLSRYVVQSISSTRSLKVVSTLTSVDEIRDAMRAGKIQAAFYIPESFEKDIKSGTQAHVTVYKNTANLIFGNLVLKDASTIIKTVSAGKQMKSVQSRGMTPQQAYNATVPIRVETYPLFNPAYSYESFLAPGLITVMLHMIIMIAAVLVLNRELRSGTLMELFRTAKGSISAIIIGKSLPYLALHTATVLTIIGIIFPLFGIIIQGSVLATLVYLLFFAVVSFFLGFALSCIFNDYLFATEVVIFVSTPAFVLSGYTFPIWAMPGIMGGIAHALPYTHFLYGFIKIYQMGAPASYLLTDVAKLVLYLIGALLLSAIALYMRRRKLINPNLEVEAA